MNHSRSLYRTIWQNAVDKNNSAFQTSMCNAARFSGCKVPSGAEDAMTQWLHSDEAMDFIEHEASDMRISGLVKLGIKPEEFWECQVKAINKLCGKEVARVVWYVTKKDFPGLIGEGCAVVINNHIFRYGRQVGTWVVPSVISMSDDPDMVIVDDPVGNPGDYYETTDGQANDGFGLEYHMDDWWSCVSNFSKGLNTFVLVSNEFEDDPDSTEG
jgi:hypothetical protein